MKERETAVARIVALAEALNCHTGVDASNEPCIWGRVDKAAFVENNIHADGEGFLLMVSLETSQQLTWALKALSFCQVRQEGDTEAVLYLGRLPTEAEAVAIREYLNIRKIPEYSEEVLRQKRAQMERINREKSGRVG